MLFKIALPLTVIVSSPLPLLLYPPVKFAFPVIVILSLPLPDVISVYLSFASSIFTVSLAPSTALALASPVSIFTLFNSVLVAEIVISSFPGPFIGSSVAPPSPSIEPPVNLVPSLMKILSFPAPPDTPPIPPGPLNSAPLICIQL